MAAYTSISGLPAGRLAYGMSPRVVIALIVIPRTCAPDHHPTNASGMLQEEANAEGTEPAALRPEGQVAASTSKGQQGELVSNQTCGAGDSCVTCAAER